MKYLKKPLPWLLLIAWNLILLSLYINYKDDKETKENWTPQTIALSDGTVIVSGKQFGKDKDCPTFSKVVCSCGSSHWIRLEESLEESPLIVPKLKLNSKFEESDFFPNKFTLRKTQKVKAEFTQKCKKCGSELQWYNYWMQN